MIERRQFLAGVGIAAVFPLGRAATNALPISVPASRAPASGLLASNALALLRG